MTGAAGPEPPGARRGARPRSPRKRAAILDAAMERFLSQGYGGTSVDEIAADAAVSKQTIYQHFGSKERLLTEAVLEVAAFADAFVETSVAGLGESEDLESDLARLARDYIATTLQPRVVELRRLVIAEAGRFPGLARAYYDRVPERVLDALAAALARLAERGALRIEAPRLAAQHLAWLLLFPVDRAMFRGVEHAAPADDLDVVAREGVRVFLAAYRA